jgi:putative ABC transport system permease protein
VQAVKAAGLTSTLPLSGARWRTRISIEGRPQKEGEFLGADQRMITPGLLQALSVPLRSGRTFDDHDTANSMLVALVNETFARRYFGNQDPIGKRVKWGLESDADLPWLFTIVGVVGDVRGNRLEAPAEPELYMDFTQMEGAVSKMAPTEMTLVVQWRDHPLAGMGAVRERVSAISSQVRVADVRTLDEVLASSHLTQRVVFQGFAFFGLIALALSGAGIYSVVAYLTKLRTQEVAVRLALGASPREIRRMFLGRGFRLALTGIGLGLIGSWFTVSLLSSMLIDVSPHSFAIMFAVALVLTLSALIASYFPARSVSVTVPSAALR